VIVCEFENQTDVPTPSDQLTPFPLALALSPLRRNADDINSAILNTVRAGSGAYFNVSERCAALKEKAGWIVDFDHFRRLCLSDMRQAFDEGCSEGKQAAHNRKRTWHTLFNYCAARLKITRKLAIKALDRQGNYLCMLVEKDEDEDAAWQEFLRLGRRFGILNTQLETLRRVAQVRQERDEQKAESKRQIAGIKLVHHKMSVASD
jgi:hypothetical protein